MRRPHDLSRVGLLLIAGFAHLLWLASVWVNAGTEELARRDWSAFRAAGRAALGGEALYEPSQFPFLHPPIVAVLSAPVSPLGDLAFYAVTAVLSALGLAGVAWAVRGPLDARGDLVVLGALASAPWLIGLTLGQPIAVLVAAWLIGGVWLERRPFEAGLVWSVCALKPTFLIPLLALAAIRGSRRALAGVLLGVCGLTVLALPLEPDAYAGWLAAMLREQPLASLSWKQHTLLALLRGVVSPSLVWPVWGLSALAIGGFTLRRVHRQPASLQSLGVLALATVTLSPYAYFYDALLLIVPLAAALREPSVSRRRSLLGCALLTAVTQYVLFFAVQSGPALAAIPALIWLAVALRGR